MGRVVDPVVPIVGVEDRAVELYSGGEVGLGDIGPGFAICVINFKGGTVEGAQSVIVRVVWVRLFNREVLRRQVEGREPRSNTSAGGALVVSTIQCTGQGVSAPVSEYGDRLDIKVREAVHTLVEHCCAVGRKILAIVESDILVVEASGKGPNRA